MLLSSPPSSPFPPWFYLHFPSAAPFATGRNLLCYRPLPLPPLLPWSFACAHAHARTSRARSAETAARCSWRASRRPSTTRLVRSVLVPIYKGGPADFRLACFHVIHVTLIAVRASNFFDAAVFRPIPLQLLRLMLLFLVPGPAHCCRCACAESLDTLGFASNARGVASRATVRVLDVRAEAQPLDDDLVDPERAIALALGEEPDQSWSSGAPAQALLRRAMNRRAIWVDTARHGPVFARAMGDPRDELILFGTSMRGARRKEQRGHAHSQRSECPSKWRTYVQKKPRFAARSLSIPISFRWCFVFPLLPFLYHAVHGSGPGNSSLFWNELCFELAVRAVAERAPHLRAFYMVAIDCPGYGFSPGDRQTVRSSPGALLSDVVRALRKPRALALVGSSQGACAVFNAVLEAPALCKYIAVRDPVGHDVFRSLPRAEGADGAALGTAAFSLRTNTYARAQITLPLQWQVQDDHAAGASDLRHGGRRAPRQGSDIFCRLFRALTAVNIPLNIPFPEITFVFS